MIGLSVELKYPNQRHTLIVSGLMSQSVHVGSRMAMMKNGNQQHTNAPVMMASVLAALRSRLESVADWDFFFMIDGLADELDAPPCPEGYAVEKSAVGGSASMRSRSTPLPRLPFSGLVLADDTFVKAVVVSLIVGRGRPMTATTAAAIPPEPPTTFAVGPPMALVGCDAVTFQRKPIDVSAIHEAFAKGSGWV